MATVCAKVTTAKYKLRLNIKTCNSSSVKMKINSEGLFFAFQRGKKKKTLGVWRWSAGNQATSFPSECLNHMGYFFDMKSCSCSFKFKEVGYGDNCGLCVIIDWILGERKTSHKRRYWDHWGDVNMDPHYITSAGTLLGVITRSCSDDREGPCAYLFKAENSRCR